MNERMHLETSAHIHSKGGQFDNVVIVERRGDNQYIAEYRGGLYTAIFNPWAGWYVDDVYGIVCEPKN